MAAQTTTQPAELRQLGLGLRGDGPGDFTGRYNTPIPASKTAEFASWAAAESKRQGREVLLDKGDYDLQGFWLSGDYKQAEARGHGSDKWKKPNHPTFSTDSKYHGVDGFYGGRWQKNTFAVGRTNFYSPAQLAAYFSEREPGVAVRDPRSAGSESEQNAHYEGLARALGGKAPLALETGPERIHKQALIDQITASRARYNGLESRAGLTPDQLGQLALDEVEGIQILEHHRTSSLDRQTHLSGLSEIERAIQGVTIESPELAWQRVDIVPSVSALSKPLEEPLGKEAERALTLEETAQPPLAERFRDSFAEEMTRQPRLPSLVHDSTLPELMTRGAGREYKFYDQARAILNPEEDQARSAANRIAEITSPEDRAALLQSVERVAADRAQRGFGGRIGQTLLESTAETSERFAEALREEGRLPEEQREFVHDLLLARRKGLPLKYGKELGQPWRWIANAAIGGAEALPPMTTGILAAVGAAAVGGPQAAPIANAAFWYTQIYPDAIREMEDAGLPPKQAQLAARISAAAESAIESLMVNPLTPKKLVAEPVRAGLRGVAKRAVLQYAKRFGKEWAEEPAQAFFREADKAITTRLKEEVPDTDTVDLIRRPYEATRDSFGPLLALTLPGGVYGGARGFREYTTGEKMRGYLLDKDAKGAIALAMTDPERTTNIAAKSAKGEDISKSDVGNLAQVLTKAEDRKQFGRIVAETMEKGQEGTQTLVGVPGEAAPKVRPDMETSLAEVMGEKLAAKPGVPIAHPLDEPAKPPPSSMKSVEGQAAQIDLVETVRRGMLADHGRLGAMQNKALQKQIQANLDAGRNTLASMGFDADVEMVGEAAEIVLRRRKAALSAEEEAGLAEGGGVGPPRKPTDLDPDGRADRNPLERAKEFALRKVFYWGLRADERVPILAREAGLPEDAAQRLFYRAKLAQRRVQNAQRLIRQEYLEQATVREPGGQPRRITAEEQELIKSVLERIPKGAINEEGKPQRFGARQRAGLLYVSTMPKEIARAAMPVVQSPETGLPVLDVESGEKPWQARITRVYSPDKIRVRYRSGHEADLDTSDVRLSALDPDQPPIGLALPDGRVVGAPVLDPKSGRHLALQLYRDFQPAESQALYEKAVAQFPQIHGILAALRRPAEEAAFDLAGFQMPPQTMELWDAYAGTEGLLDVPEALRSYVPDILKARGPIRRALSFFRYYRAPGRRFKSGMTREQERLDQMLAERDMAGEPAREGATATVPLLEAVARRRGEMLLEAVQNDMLANAIQILGRPIKKGLPPPQGWTTLDRLRVRQTGATDAEAMNRLVRLVRARSDVFEPRGITAEAAEGARQQINYREDTWIVPTQLFRLLDRVVGPAAPLYQTNPASDPQAIKVLRNVDRATGRALSLAAATSMLSRPATANRNFTSGTLQALAKIIEDSYNGLLSVVPLARSDHGTAEAGDKLLGDLIAVVPWKFHGRGGKYAMWDVNRGLVERTFAQDIALGGVGAKQRTIEGIPLALFNEYEVLFQRAMAASGRTAAARREWRRQLEAGQVKPEQKEAFYREFAESMNADVYGAMYDPLKTFAFDYSNQTPVGEWFSDKSAAGRAVLPFPKWIYNFARLYLRYLNPANFAKLLSKSADTRREGLARLCTGATILALTHEVVDRLMPHAQNLLRKMNVRLGEDPSETVAVGVSGRLKVPAPGVPEGFELWLRAGDIPFISEAMAYFGLGKEGTGVAPGDYVRERLTFGPALRAFMTATTGMRDEYQRYRPRATVVGENMRVFIPFQPWLEYFARLEDPVQRRYWDEHNSGTGNFFRAIADTLPWARKLNPPQVVRYGERKGKPVVVSQWREFAKMFVLNLKMVSAENRTNAETEALLRADPLELETNAKLREFYTDDMLRRMIWDRWTKSKPFRIKRGREEDVLILQKVLRQRTEGPEANERTERLDQLLQQLRQRKGRQLEQAMPEAAR